ncbi:hypothetical protein [Candidatus Poriferisocius sp.]|uniref:hypothetical protein n=1 Tax=Candidatus Poriferisocius sp. TaxID=3101276 RepID=UPI003B02A88B
MVALLVTLTGVFFAAVLTAVGFIVKMVFNHDKTDAVIIEKVGGLDTRMGRMEERMDKVDEKLGNVVDTLARIEGRLA